MGLGKEGLRAGEGGGCLNPLPRPPLPRSGLKHQAARKGGGGLGRAHIHIPENDPHNALLILRYVSWGEE